MYSIEAGPLFGLDFSSGIEHWEQAAPPGAAVEVVAVVADNAVEVAR